MAAAEIATVVTTLVPEVAAIAGPIAPEIPPVVGTLATEFAAGHFALTEVAAVTRPVAAEIAAVIAALDPKFAAIAAAILLELTPIIVPTAVLRGGGGCECGDAYRGQRGKQNELTHGVSPDTARLRRTSASTARGTGAFRQPQATR